MRLCPIGPDRPEVRKHAVVRGRREYGEGRAEHAGNRERDRAARLRPRSAEKPDTRNREGRDVAGSRTAADGATRRRPAADDTYGGIGTRELGDQRTSRRHRRSAARVRSAVNRRCARTAEHARAMRLHRGRPLPTTDESLRTRRTPERRGRHQRARWVSGFSADRGRSLAARSRSRLPACSASALAVLAASSHDGMFADLWSVWTDRAQPHAAVPEVLARAGDLLGPSAPSPRSRASRRARRAGCSRRRAWSASRPARNRGRPRHGRARHGNADRRGARRRCRDRAADGDGAVARRPGGRRRRSGFMLVVAPALAFATTGVPW